MNNNSGARSSRAPTPYITAATCLHMIASSGQLQVNEIADGAGNKPVRSAHSRAITGSESRPLSRSRRDPMLPAQSFWIARQASSLTALISITTS